MDYLVPLNKDLDIPYRANSKLKNMVDYLFSHPSLPRSSILLYRACKTSGSKQLLNDMSIRAIAMTKHYVDNQQQYGYKMENIYMQIIIRMWKQTFKHMKLQNKEPLDEYITAKMKLLSIENGLWDELLRVVREEDYIVHGDDMRKKTRKIKTHTGYLCGLE